MEREADKIGVELMGRACFDPLSASSVFVRMEEDDKKKGGGGSSSSYLSTHPGHGERVGNLTKWGREVKGKMKGREGECAEINRRWEEMRRGKVRRRLKRSDSNSSYISILLTILPHSPHPSG